MRRFAIRGSVRRNRLAAAETLQALAAVTIVVMCAGLVIAAAFAATSHALERTARERAQLQAEIVLDALVSDLSLAGGGGAIVWAKAESVAGGSSELSFRPDTLEIVTLRAVAVGSELFLLGSGTDLSSELVYGARPVPIVVQNGNVVAGVLRAGVSVR